MINGHGDDLHLFGTKIKVNFSTNIFNRADHSALLAHLASRPSLLVSYPEPEPRSLEAFIAGRGGTDPESVMVTNGATEAIYLIAHAFSGASSAVVEPTFREYSDACSMYGHTLACITSLTSLANHTRLCWLCNPNNPTGSVIPRRDLLEAVDANPATIFVIDQAYGNYTALPLLTAADAAERPNLILLESLTKRFAVPGLRIGVLFACPAITRRLREFRIPWSVNAPAIEAARFLIDNSEAYPIDAEALHSEALRMAEAFRSMEMEVAPTECNFILCRLPKGTAAELKEYLATRHGLLIRDASNFHSLTPRHFRVAAQLPDENNLLINAISQWMHSC